MNTKQPIQFKDDVSIVLCGEAGQGIQTIEVVLTHILKHAGYHVFATKEYMSRIRGGSNSTEIRVASRRVSGFVKRIDFLIPLDQKAISHLDWRLTDQTVIVGDQDALKTDKITFPIPFRQMANKIGGEIYSNTIAAGFIAGVFNVEKDSLASLLKGFFSKKSGEIQDKNAVAGLEGWTKGQEFLKLYDVKLSIERTNDLSKEFFFNGGQAVGLGALAGGCNFIAAYPMSPSTSVLTFLAEQAETFGIVVDQAEDEIAAINMALGSWYAGGRALASTSGGGFALMTEGLSLAGSIEMPLVIHLAQRPGPATGLPTRTEQGDLELALYSGHGEFPRVIYAPGNLEDAFSCTAKAFEIADRYQVPVFILTDQFLIDSYYNIPSIDLPKVQPIRCIVTTDENYKRYRLTADGVSPRGIPGLGLGVVRVDSDEHDEDGYITEDFRMRTSMVKKRLKKMELLLKEALQPELFGNKNYEKLIIGWGSTYSAIQEAFLKKGESTAAFLYCKQVYPLPSAVLDHLKRAKEIVIVENNATGQFAKLIKRETGLSAHRQILKYDGFPFSVEELMELI